MSARKKDTESFSDDDTTGKVLNILTNNIKCESGFKAPLWMSSDEIIV
jgi:hypothetical protein